MTKEKIAKLLLELKAVDLNTKEGFVYASGIKSPIYCDNRIILSYEKEREDIIEGFLNLIKEKPLEFDFIAGVATAGIPWGAILADRLKKPFVFVRASKKDHGKGNQIEGEIEEGKKVLVVEDLISTGGSALSACRTLTDSSCSVAACIAIFNYQMEDSLKNFTEAKISLYSLSDFSTLVKIASETEYINAEEKKKLMEWHQNPKDWKP